MAEIIVIYKQRLFYIGTILQWVVPLRLLTHSDIAN